MNVGDYVNGNKVINILYKEEKEIPTIVKCLYENSYKNEDIKSIVTKEQFKKMEYEVK